MACNGATCHSGGCDRTPLEAKQRPIHTSLCLKCKVKEPIGKEEEQDRLCVECFRSNLYGKFKHAVSSNAMITPSDKVLLAFSGGPSSRVALQFVHEMQQRAQKNYDASKDRSLPVFGVGVAFIASNDIHPFASEEIENAVLEIKSVVSNLSPPVKKLHVVPIKSIYSSTSSDGNSTLSKLLDAIGDDTGREDFLVHLRMLLLQKIAAENGYNRIVVGTCTSRIASHVIAATVKGKGYSLPADIQYVDSRWEIPVVLPLRDCQAREICMLCRLDGLKTVVMPSNTPCTINELVSSFVEKLQEENPSRECTIVRTAGKLIPFNFNRIPEIKDHKVPLATRRRQKRLNLKSNDSILSESFCLICSGPLNKSDLPSLGSFGDKSSSSKLYRASCCLSCQFQILPEDLASMEQFFRLLPQPVVSRATHEGLDNFSSLREQIQDCLLLESDDDT